MSKSAKSHSNNHAATKAKALGLVEVIAIGIGGMVGGGIISVLGLTVQIAAGGAYLSFLVGGLVALLTGYSYAKLSVRYPSRGGTTTFINEVFGVPVTAGTLNVLLWLGYFIMLSLYAYAFGAYSVSIFDQPANSIWRHVVSSAVIAAFVALNMLRSATVGKVESYLVYFKLAVLIFFVVCGLFFIDAARITPSAFADFGPIVFAGVITFLAYEGFELIANAAEDVSEPHKNLPRAYYGCILFVTALYVAVALVAVGNLAPADIEKYKDFALAAATRPFLGSFGFTLMALAAAISTASAINSTLYGATKFIFVIAQHGELPHEFARNIWNKPIVGLLATGLGTLVLVNVANLESISTMGSSVFLIVFAAVNYANYRLHQEIGSSGILAFTGLLLCLMALAAVVYYTLTTNPLMILVLAGMLIASFAVEIALVVVRRPRVKFKEQFRLRKANAPSRT
ncbi:MAG: APC family permease [Pseudomonadota bacterium]|nr:APC family permease [Pseudomonadota bacterium]